MGTSGNGLGRQGSSSREREEALAASAHWLTMRGCETAVSRRIVGLLKAISNTIRKFRLSSLALRSSHLFRLVTWIEQAHMSNTCYTEGGISHHEPSGRASAQPARPSVSDVFCQKGRSNMLRFHTEVPPRIAQSCDIPRR